MLVLGLLKLLRGDDSCYLVARELLIHIRVYEMKRGKKYPTK